MPTLNYMIVAKISFGKAVDLFIHFLYETFRSFSSENFSLFCENLSEQLA